MIAQDRQPSSGLGSCMLPNTQFSAIVLAGLGVCHAHAFDNVTHLGAMAKGPIKTLQALPDGLEVTYANGNQVRLKNVDHPRNGSPVNYQYMVFDEALQAFVIDVWRVGKQTVLLSKMTGLATEVGSMRTVSPNKRLIFSTDCLETGCYYQLTQWPSGKRLAYAQAPASTGRHAGATIPQAIDLATVEWTENTQVAFAMPCALAGPTLHAAPARLVVRSKQWRLQPADPCSQP